MYMKDELARGDILKSVQCYMNDTGATEEVAREYIDGLIYETWKTLNKDMFGSYPFSEPFLTAIPNFGRTAQCFYQYGRRWAWYFRWLDKGQSDISVGPILSHLVAKKNSLDHELIWLVLILCIVSDLDRCFCDSCQTWDCVQKFPGR